jgi:rSAM/selenodomain-associated transferase 2
MPAAVTVVIPTRNEEPYVAATVASAFAAGASEVIVSDGGSSDATVALAVAAGARIVSGDTMRACQLNRGAAEARGDAIIFLHADTLLPIGAADAVAHAVASGAEFGGFRLAFRERGRRLRFAAAMINLRTRITRCPWGDQAQFVRRDAFRGFREIPIMEDYELAARMKRRGHVVLLPLTVMTSGRRFLEKGLLRTSAINWSIIVRWHLGTDPERLARAYRGRGISAPSPR